MRSHINEKIKETKSVNSSAEAIQFYTTAKKLHLHKSEDVDQKSWYKHLRLWSSD